MTAEEAMERARKIGELNVQCLMDAMRSGGSGEEINLEVETERKRWAAALIRAQIDTVAECRKHATSMKTLEGRAIFYDWLRNEHVLLDAALAKLEGRDDTHNCTKG